MKWLFDLESDGLLEEATTIHCAVFKNLDSGEVISFTPATGFKGMILYLERTFWR